MDTPDDELRRAAFMGRMQDVQRLISRGADPKALGKLNARSTQRAGVSAMHCAAMGGQDEIVRFLAKAGVDTEQPSADVGNTPLHFAALGNHRTTIKLLVKDLKVDAVAVNNDGKTALDLARLFNYGEAIDLLVRLSIPKKLASKLGAATPRGSAAAGGGAPQSSEASPSRSSAASTPAAPPAAPSQPATPQPPPLVSHASVGAGMSAARAAALAAAAAPASNSLSRATDDDEVRLRKTSPLPMTARASPTPIAAAAAAASSASTPASRSGFATARAPATAPVSTANTPQQPLSAQRRTSADEASSGTSVVSAPSPSPRMRSTSMPSPDTVEAMQAAVVRAELAESRARMLEERVAYLEKQLSAALAKSSGAGSATPGKPAGERELRPNELHVDTVTSAAWAPVGAHRELTIDMSSREFPRVYAAMDASGCCPVRVTALDCRLGEWYVQRVARMLEQCTDVRSEPDWPERCDALTHAARQALLARLPPPTQRAPEGGAGVREFWAWHGVGSLDAARALADQTAPPRHLTWALQAAHALTVQAGARQRGATGVAIVGCVCARSVFPQTEMSDLADASNLGNADARATSISADTVVVSTLNYTPLFIVEFRRM